MNGLAEEVVERLGYGPESLWSLLYAAQAGALTLALVEPLDQRLALTAAGDLLGDALDELEDGYFAICPALGAELPEPQLDQLGTYRLAIVALLVASVEVVREQVDSSLETRALLSLSHILHLTSSASALVDT